MLDEEDIPGEASQFPETDSLYFDLRDAPAVDSIEAAAGAGTFFRLAAPDP